jgi:ABC-2 type transport system permease protein
MHREIAQLDVASRRRSLLGYSLGMAVYVLIVVALYPSFKDTTSLDDFIANDPTAAALFGVTGTLTSPAGWLNGNIYANFFPLVMLLMTIGYGAASLAGQDEDGTLCLVAALPVRRTVVVLEKLAAMAIQAAALAAVVAVCVLVGRSFDVDVTLGRVVAVSVAVLLMGLGFGLVTMAVGAATGRRATALGVGTAVAAASYLISSLAPVVGWLDPVKYLSLFYWSVGDNQIARGVSLGDYAVLSVVALGGLYATVIAFRRLDLH